MKHNTNRDGGVPCGHVADAIVVEATSALVAYCVRCQRAYESAPALHA